MSRANIASFTSLPLRRSSRARSDHPQLDTIPSELIFKIITYLHRVQDLANLSRTCRRFWELIRHDGWMTYVQRRFPSLLSELPSTILQSPAGWRDAARLLTVQSRAWDRRAF